MSQTIINSLAEFETYLGKEIGVSEYIKISQEQINMFADATLDHQWIHLDEERAKKESQFGTTIAHGYLTVSLLPNLWQNAVRVENVKMMVNYGIENLKFSQPVLVNQEVRVRVSVKYIKNLRGIAKICLHPVMEIKGEKKPAFEGDVIFLYHFNE